jgi:predicted  nucleic acid-binding Zn-ribbon protein
MIKCQKCGFLHQDSELHITKCSKCGNNDPYLFIRIDKEDLEPEKYLTKRDKEWLKNRLF